MKQILKDNDIGEQKRYISLSDIDYDKFMKNVKNVMGGGISQWPIPKLPSDVGKQINPRECNVNKHVTGMVLIMIVKNESDIIKRCLSSTLGVVDAICITDTNSDHPKDNPKIKKYCPDIIKEWANENNMPCVVPIHEFTPETFQFDIARTLSFINGRKYYPNAKYFITIDADMELKIKKTFDVNKLTADAYFLIQQSINRRYENLRIIKAQTNSKVRGCTHEFWSIDKIVTSEQNPNQSTIAIKDTCFDLEIIDHDDGRCKSDKYLRDKYLIERDLLRKTTDPDIRVRYLFYLAQTYMCLNNNDWSIDFYRLRFGAGHWDEERWYCLFMIGQLYVRKWNEHNNNLRRITESLKLYKAKIDIDSSDVYDKELMKIGRLSNYDAAVMIIELRDKLDDIRNNIKKSMLEAYSFRPTRAEPLYYLAKFYREYGDNELGFYYSMQAFKIGYPKGDKLFIDSNVYDFLIDFEISICGYYVLNKRQFAVSAHRRLKHIYNKLPDHMKRAVDNNDKFYQC